MIIIIAIYSVHVYMCEDVSVCGESVWRVHELQTVAMATMVHQTHCERRSFVALGVASSLKCLVLYLGGREGGREGGGRGRGERGREGGRGERAGLRRGPGIHYRRMCT